MKRILVFLVALPLLAQQPRLASDFEIAQMEKQLARARGFEARLSARLNLGDARATRNERSLAREEYAKALALANEERLDARRESSMTRYAIATSYAGLAQAKLGRDAESFALFEDAVRYTSDEAETWNLYASAMRILGDPAKAVAAARNAVAIGGKTPLDQAIYQHALASMLIEAGQLDEAERLLVTVTESLRSSKFDALRREVARAEAFEVHSSARGDVAAYVSLLNRAQLRLAALYEQRGADAKAREQYERVLAGRSDDATALAGLGRWAEAFEANPFSMALIREYRTTLTSRSVAPSGDTAGERMRRALVQIARGETRAARATLDALSEQFPANETLRSLRREIEPKRVTGLHDLRALLDGFETLAPEQRVALDAMTFTSIVSAESTIDGVPVRFTKAVQLPAEVTFRIEGVSGNALLAEPLWTAAASAAALPGGSHAAAFESGGSRRRTPKAGVPMIAFTNRGIVEASGTGIFASDDKAVALDALNDEATIIENGHRTRIRTAATPIAAAFLGKNIYILCRDGNVLQRVGGPSIAVAGDLMTVINGKLHVYSRITGEVAVIENDRITKKIKLAPFASDFEAGYLVYPREGVIRTLDGEKIAVGAVPVDLALAGGGTALTARVLAVADPSAKRVWLTEGKQSMSKAIARGFLRGFLGLGLYGNRSSQFPTGVDRVVARGSRWIAYDSSTGTLYRVEKRKSSVIAKGVASNAFTLTKDGVAWHDGTSVAQMTFR